METRHIDTALGYFYSHKKFCTQLDLFEHLIKYFKKEDINTPILINKLVKDGYVDYKKYEVFNPETLQKYFKTDYSISIDGIIFFEKGGYQNKLKKDKLQNFPKDKWYFYDIGKIIIGAIIGSGITLLIEHRQQTKTPQTSKPEIHQMDTVSGIHHN